MYRLGETQHRHRKFYSLLAGLIVLLIVLWLGLSHFLKPDTQVGKTPAPVISHISYDAPKLTTFTEPLFSISLPSDWKPITRSTDIPQPAYSWQGTITSDVSQWISVYVDQNVANLAINRALGVQTNGAKLNVLGDVSDNCTTYTGNVNLGQGTTPAKWQGINFLCDSGNYERDVVGVTSADGFNDVTPSNGHHFFLTFTDNSANPNYSVFVNALKSFQAK